MYRISEDLVLELCSDPPALVLRSRSMAADGEAVGAVTVWPDEVRQLRDALADGLAVLADRTQDNGDAR